jgi:mycofactocin system transcriptional regulator
VTQGVPQPAIRAGRPSVTSRAELEQIALELFRTRGFDQTTVDDIAGAAGIGRRTLFRYFPSKNDLVWGDFDAGLSQLRTHLAERPADQGLLAGLREAVLAFNVFPGEQEQAHRERMTLILTVPALQAHSTLRYAAWRAVIAEHAGTRLGLGPESLLPQLVAHSCLGAALTAYEQWLRTRDSDLIPLLEEALSALDGHWAEI